MTAIRSIAEAIEPESAIPERTLRFIEAGVSILERMDGDPADEFAESLAKYWVGASKPYYIMEGED